MQLQKIGMRTIKSGIGVMICSLLGMCGIINSTFFAAIACIVSMQVTVKGSLKAGIDRLKGTFIGGLIGFLFAFFAPENPVLSCLGIILTIYCCNIAKINKSVVIACVVFCSIYLTEDVSNPILYSVS